MGFDFKNSDVYRAHKKELHIAKIRRLALQLLTELEVPFTDIETIDKLIDALRDQHSELKNWVMPI